MTDTPAERAAESTWTRLRRRKVVQWGVVYVAGAWGFLQGLEYISESFNWPQQARQIAVLVLVIGLPIVLVLAWYHGDRGEQRFRGTEVAILALLLLLGGGIFWRYDRASETATTASSAAHVPGATPSKVAAAPDAKSIAVLPFVDMSASKDQEYMSDGLAEELLNLLAQAPDLKVIARTSSFAFKGEKVDIAEIAKRLNVAHILEGSVRTSGNQIRVTAQLIHAADRTHLWSETYDRPLDDIFKIQDEIADSIAQALQIKLMGGELNRHKGGTQNLAAYQLYLRAYNGEDWNSEASMKNAQALLEQAIELDPNFGHAWSVLASVYRLSAENGYLPAAEGFERARELTQHALIVSPGSTHAHSSLAAIYLTYDWDWAATEKELRQVLALDPAGLGAPNTSGRLDAALGRFEDAEQQFRHGLSRDPLNAYLKINLGNVYYLARRFAESEATYRQLLKQEPAFVWTRIALGKTLLARGDPDAALAMVRSEPDEPIRLLYLPIMLDAAGRPDEAAAALQAQIEQWADTGAYSIAQFFAYRGDRDRAFEWLERAYQQRESGLIEITGEPLLDGIADDPRFKAFLRKMNIPDVWHSADQVRRDGTE